MIVLARVEGGTRVPKGDVAARNPRVEAAPGYYEAASRRSPRDRAGEAYDRRSEKTGRKTLPTLAAATTRRSSPRSHPAPWGSP